MRSIILAVLALLLLPAIAQAAPTASFTIAPNPAVAGQVTTFDASGSVCDRSPCTYRWYHPEEFDTADGRADRTASFTYRSVDTASSTHAVTLRVRNSIGQTTSRTTQFKVVASAPPPPPPPPPVDTDGDGVNDDVDQCDTQPGPASNNGCPVTEPPPTSGVNCMPDPSSCGFPDVDNVGVLPGVARQAVSGTVTLSTAGQVYENKTVTGSIVVTAPNVTIRNVKIINTTPWYTISSKSGTSWNAPNSNLVVDHVEFDLQGYMEIKGIAFDGYTVRNSFFHDGADCAHFGRNVVLENNLCVDGPDANDDGWPDAGFGCQDGPHYDGFQSDGGSNIRISHNTIRIPCGQTSAILMSTNTSPIRDVIVENNLMAGGGYTLYCDAGAQYGTMAGVNRFTGNRFARTYFPRSGYWGPTTRCEAYPFTGNVWDDTNAPL